MFYDFKNVKYFVKKKKKLLNIFSLSLLINLV